MASPTTLSLDQELINSVIDRLRRDRPIRDTLPGDGLLNIDRRLPFLLVYRPSPEEASSRFSAILTGGASYLIAPTPKASRAWTSRLVAAIARELSKGFGAFLIIELWPSAEVDRDGNSAAAAAKPRFMLHHEKADRNSATVTRLASSLERISIMKQRAVVEQVPATKIGRPGLPQLLPQKAREDLDTTVVGIDVNPIYIDPDTGDVLPLVARTLARLTARSMQRGAFQFAQTKTNDRSLHYHALGRRTFVADAKRVDQQLTAVAESFDLLMAVTPVNAEAAYRTFRRSKFEKAPRFHYRPLVVDPELAKRRLWDIKIERVEDPVLDQLFRDKRRELDLKLSLLAERERERFLHTSMGLYGRLSGDLRAAALDILEKVPTGIGGRTQRTVSVGEFIARAQEEFERLRHPSAEMNGRIIVDKDISSLMVSSGNLIIGANMSFQLNRVEPLIQHEIGTHVVTYWNGRAQPFKLLATGLAGHDELQEGLAVFVEYLVGGLTAGRLRTLAARVEAVGALVDGATFVETFRLLKDGFGISERMAFLITMRVFRGGGLTKDAVYLRGLQAVIDYLARGGRLDTLFVGKIATVHTSVIEELQRRQVLEPPPFRPSYLDQPDSHYRIERIKSNPSPADLVDA
ncbi:MAG TPA: flavohemoglobin expression-modulating QEGLA motif protein [Acidimicrobiia bacterium]|nr:flavohemoglobin expression-modulating QEGLA motif protein [Acidimicrobiia bacterium]